MKGSRILNVVHKKTDGIIKLRNTTNLEKLLFASRAFLILSIECRQKLVIIIDKILSEMISVVPKTFRIFAGEKNTQRNTVGAVIQPLPACA